MSRVWKDRIVEHPRRYKDQNGNTLVLTPDSGVVIEGGTPVNAMNLNGIEQDIVEHVNMINVVDTKVDAHLADNVNHVKYAVDTGTANAKVVTFDPTPTDYVDGMALTFKNAVQNTGAVTINANGLGAKSILKSNGNALSSGNLKVGIPYTLRYNGTAFILQGEGGEYGTANPSDVRNTKTLGTENGVVQGALNLSNLIPSNIKSGVTIDGVSGTILDATSPIAGNNIAYRDSEFAALHTGTTYSNVKQVRMGVDGRIRVEFDLTCMTHGELAYGRIYKNGVAVGTERSNNQEFTWLTFTQDFNVAKDDLIQLYLRGQYVNTGARNRIFSINTNLPSIAVKVPV